VINDLEVWLIGTPAELDRATAALAAIGRNLQHSGRRPLIGDDAGRFRAYLRVAIAVAPTPAPGRPVLRVVADPLDVTG